MSKALRAFAKHIKDTSSSADDFSDGAAGQTNVQDANQIDDQATTDDQTGESLSQADNQTTSDVQQQAPVLESITISPDSPSLKGNEQQQFSATGTFSDGPTKNMTVT